MKELLQKLEDHELQRIQLLKEATDSVIVYETNMEMNNKYDAKVFAKVAEGINLDKQIDFFKSKVGLLKVFFSGIKNRLMECQIFSLLKSLLTMAFSSNWRRRKWMIK